MLGRFKWWVRSHLQVSVGLCADTEVKESCTRCCSIGNLARKSRITQTRRGRTHWAYSEGVSKAHQSDRLRGLSTLRYALGLGDGGVEHVLTEGSCLLGQTTVWRNVPAAGGEGPASAAGVTAGRGEAGRGVGSVDRVDWGIYPAVRAVSLSPTDASEYERFAGLWRRLQSPPRPARQLKSPPPVRRNRRSTDECGWPARPGSRTRPRPRPVESGRRHPGNSQPRGVPRL